MTAYDDRIWLQHYPSGIREDAHSEFDTALAMFRASLDRAPGGAAIHYFDATVTYRDLGQMSDALAVALGERGIGKGDRVALVLQNVPQFHVAVLAAWKLGAVVVPLNPMYRDRELHAVLADSGAAVVICLESVHAEVISASSGTAVTSVITTSELDFRTREEPRIFGDDPQRGAAAGDDLLELIDRFRGRTPADVPLEPDDLAYLPYTSGTTGPPKGAMNTHANVVFTAQIYRDWTRLGPESVVYAVAPLFHITGLIANIAAPLLSGSAVILTCRFHPLVAAEAIAEHRATATIGAITVFIAWTNNDAVTAEQLSSLRSVYSGGAPVPHAALEAFRAKFGHYIHNGYGLTETTSPAVVVPHGVEAPVDPGSGAVAVGVPVSGTVVSVVDESDAPVPVGDVGEIVITGPQVAGGYWNRPDETEHAMPSGRFHTGDVGFMDAGGWFYVVDRKKDQINASGFKVWPREVEDVLYEHPAVREAAVVGVVDPYRGETVKAVVSLKPGRTADVVALQEFCRGRLAAYKCPRVVEVRDDLPKTVSGKILRRALRES
ncbi:Fatty-acid--CoA ligase [Rhodococcus sp. RD6.2]|uniref:class I adenylate-forming enzyme family protein n=1 Tax=Rhodococcus sp. RD6.2 TaxID=260936 RepID=UPI00063B8FC5|nr:AMP-binding protein [Rhodococcus sp. RD6.2]CRK51615.1 Fatty-acid--CoA ligase [Rhodococcus sp. RD6.2]